MLLWDNNMGKYATTCFAIIVFFSLFGCNKAEEDRNAKDSLKYFPAKVSSEKPDVSLPDSLFLLQTAKDTWKFFENSTYGNTGLVVDKVFIDKQNAAHFTSITNIGLYMVSTIAAYKLNIITRDDAIAKIKTTLQSLKKLETYNGFYYNWYELDIMKQSGGFVSTVDSGWLYASLMVVAKEFDKEFGNECNSLIKKADFNWLYDQKEGAFRLGYDVAKKEFSIYHYKLLVSEARIAFYMGVIKDGLNPNNWFKLNRTLAPEITQEQIPKGKMKTVNDVEYFNGYYMYDSLKIVPSWGGSSFEYFMTDLFVDERPATKGIGLNNQNQILAQIDFCLNKNNYKVWGLSPCATIDGGYGEFGVDPIGTMIKGYGKGTVTPHASVIALNYMPKEVIDNMKTMLASYDIYGEYGFYDCIEMKTGNTCKTYLALDQAMLFLSIANYLTDNYIPKLFTDDKNMQQLLKIIKEEEFYN